jgi:glyoxylase-like metal-dependent hydrolase (beta-lactamase superfamily II)
MTPPQSAPRLPGDIRVFERGWLSSNNVLLHDPAGAVLVDTGHALHADQTVALVRAALRNEPLAAIVNTHLHSDHCGGNAALQRAFGAPITIPPGLWDAVQRWDEDALTYRPSGQRCERFAAAARLAPGDTLAVGTRRWQVRAAPGHDPHSVILFDDRDGVLISADALWEHGFGVVFPELEGEAAFDEVGATLDLIATLPARWVIPGHGAPFTDVAGALARARSRLAGFRVQPERHARHAVKVLVKYHVMEERSLPLEALLHWSAETPLLRALWHRFGVDDEPSALRWCERFVHELVKGGALTLDGGVVGDA